MNIPRAKAQKCAGNHAQGDEILTKTPRRSSDGVQTHVTNI
jgi:hypothetical protein